MDNTSNNKEVLTSYDIDKIFGDLTSNIYGIILLLSLSCTMLLVHLYLAFFFHNG